MTKKTIITISISASEDGEMKIESNVKAIDINPVAVYGALCKVVYDFASDMASGKFGGKTVRAIDYGGLTENQE